MMNDSMFFASAQTTQDKLRYAIPSLVAQVREQMKGRSIDAIFAFLSPNFFDSAVIFSRELRFALQPQLLLGCTGESIIGRYEEIESEPAISLVAAHLPGITLTPFALQTDDWPSLLANTNGLRNRIGANGEPKLLIMLADPFSTPMDSLLTSLRDAYDGLPVIGGMASGARRPGGNALLLNGQLYSSGAVAVALAGALDVDLIVSQGCRPIGRTFRITKAERNIILTIDDQPPLLSLQLLYRDLSEEERDLIRNGGLFIGRAIRTDIDDELLGRGDFLIRSVIGVDHEIGALTVGNYVQEGELIQFHLRDADTAQEDLEMMLLPQTLYEAPSGGLLFSCNGRGTRLYDHPNGDISTIQEALGGIDIAGFFCAGELGPIGGQNFVHGHTASLVLFRPA
jgi:small ligand-binding sensory domain FIST